MLKVVMDTNQFVSSMINKHGPSARILEAWRSGQFILILSQNILDEIKRALDYPHIRQKYRFNQEDIESLLQLIEHEAVILSDTIDLHVIKEDPDDDKILACALEAQANYIVSGDQHLLNLLQYQNIPITTAQKFLEILRHP